MSTGDGGFYPDPNPPALTADDLVRERASQQIEAELSGRAGIRPAALCPWSQPGELASVAPSLATPSVTCVQPVTSKYLAVKNKRQGKGNLCTPGTTNCSSLGRKAYTCAAAAVRNLTFTVTGNDKGEKYFENKLQLSPSQGLLGEESCPSQGM